MSKPSVLNGPAWLGEVIAVSGPKAMMAEIAPKIRRLSNTGTNCHGRMPPEASALFLDGKDLRLGAPAHTRPMICPINAAASTQ